MSRSVDLFIDADMSLDEFAAALGGQAGSPLIADPDRSRWLLQEGQAHATLAEHPYGDDGALLFTRYRFALSARVSNEFRPHDTPEAALLRRLAQKIQQGPAWPVLLVLDLQYRDQIEADGGAAEPAGPAPAESAGPAPAEPSPAAGPEPAPAVGGAG